MINLLGNVWLYSFSFTVMTLRLVSCGMNKIYKWGFYKSYYTSCMYVPSTYTPFAPWKFSKSLLKSKSFSNIVDFKLSKVLYMSFEKFLLAVVSRDLSQADKSIIRVSSFSIWKNFNFWMIKFTIIPKKTIWHWERRHSFNTLVSLR